MKRFFLKRLICASLLIVVFSHLQAETSEAEEKNFNLLGSRETFALSPVTDGLLFGSGLLLSGGNLITKYAVKINRQEYDGKIYDKDDVNSFDRLFMNSYSATNDKIADFLMAASMASPRVLAATDREEWFTCAVMYAETLMIANGIKETVKLFVNRPRPYMYYDSETFPEDVNDNGDWADSFFSGHATLSFAGATFASYAFWKYFPESKWRIPVLAGSYTLAATTAVMRLSSGNHFMTDVLTGAVIGSGVGFLVPWLHTFNAKHKDFNVGVLANGFSVAVKF